MTISDGYGLVGTSPPAIPQATDRLIQIADSGRCHLRRPYFDALAFGAGYLSALVGVNASTSGSPGPSSYHLAVPALVAVVGGLLFASIGAAVFTDFRGMRTRMVQRRFLTPWARVKSDAFVDEIDRKERINGAGWAIVGLILLGFGIGMIVTWA